MDADIIQSLQFDLGRFHHTNFGSKRGSYSDVDAASFTFEIANMFSKVRTTIVDPMIITLPKIVCTGFYVLYYLGDEGSSLEIAPHATNSINQGALGASITYEGTGSPFLIVILSTGLVHHIASLGQGTNVSIDVVAGDAIGVVEDPPGTFTVSSEVVVAAGSDISVVEAPTGTFTVTNDAPDQVVTLTAGSGCTVTGSYPNFTISVP